MNTCKERISINIKYNRVLKYHINQMHIIISIGIMPAVCHSQKWCQNTMMTSSNESIFRVAGYLCGDFTGHRWIPCTKASDAELWRFFDLRPNERLSILSWGWWFETPSRQLWDHCDAQWGLWVLGACWFDGLKSKFMCRADNGI